MCLFAYLTNLPEDQRNQGDCAKNNEDGDDARSEPVVFLPLVENELQRAEAKRKQPEANVVEVQAALAHRRDFLAGYAAGPRPRAR